MVHFGAVCPPIPGHINPMAALGQELVRRGHRVTFFHIPDIAGRIAAEGLDFCPVGAADYPPGSLAESTAELGRLSGLGAVRFTVECGVRLTRLLCAHLPAALETEKVEMLLVDQNEPAGGSCAEWLDIPFVSICGGLPINREPAIPPAIMPWAHSTAPWARLRNRLGYALVDRVIAPLVKELNHFRHQWKLPLHRGPDESFSSLAQISQMTEQFDFPHAHLPACFHHTGPFAQGPGRPVPFAWERLDGRPLIYASLGTLQNNVAERFYCIAQACAGLEAQLVLSLGGGGRVEDYAQLPGDPLVVGYAPQLALLEKAQLTITHAGFNTVLESLSRAVPMVAIPVTNDHPGVAARLARTGAGEVLPLQRLNAERLRVAVRRVLEDGHYRVQAERLRTSICEAGGAIRAADIVEAASTGKAVTALHGR